jgi:cyclopropane-fatty-acyl-phospholipid synthase
VADLATTAVLHLLRRSSRSARSGEGTLRLTGSAVPAPGMFVTGSGHPDVTVRVHDRRAFGTVLGRGSVGLATSYRDGWWDTDDLTGLVRILSRRTAGMRRLLDAVARKAGAPLAAAQRLAPPSKADDRRHVAAHYDLSNEFFALMLDRTMAYSCAYFERPGMSLEEAQRAKFDLLARKLELSAGDEVVEIGTGWGGLAVHLAERYRCRVTTTTISAEQRSHSERLVKERHLEDRVTVLGSDYRDLTGSYDALVSVEMVEAVDWRRHDEFFAVCHRLLRPGGRMGLQAITIEERSYQRARLHDDFVRRLVFPGGTLPSLGGIVASLARTPDLRLVHLQDIGAHYGETLRQWRANLVASEAGVAALGFTDSFRRLWDLYLCYCEAAFEERHVSDVQVVLARPASPVPRHDAGAPR